ncbi:MAG: type II glyceraldehyde-3-phosphate dehydrogenase [Hydrogenophilaceae bacterium]|nr:type II glyceraldehyde-3-phosphate dehydrogenase [Hydrogenophilaceae bacterium]
MDGYKVRVGVNGYGVIGKRIADAVAAQEDMELAGVADIVADWRIQPARRRGFAVFAAAADAGAAMRAQGVDIAGALADLVAQSDVIIDCTPKKIAAANIEIYRGAGKKFIVQGGEKHATTGHSFVAASSYASALDRQSTRVVSCNTTSIVRTLGALKRAGLLRRARGTLLRRATDPWESHLGGVMNTLVPEANIPSHQGPDAQSVDPDLDVVTMAVKTPETLAHVHYWTVQMTRPAGKQEVLEAFAVCPRLLPIRMSEGLSAINAVKEWTADAGRLRGDLYEVAFWEDMLTVEGDELFYAYMVDNQAIVIPETIDAIRALTGVEREADASMRKTDRALGIPLRIG